jgi:hypothetical protein
MRREQPLSMFARLLAQLRGRNAARHAPKGKPQPFQAIAIFQGIRSCEMAAKFSEHRFLAKDAPRLPLPGCTMTGQCTCRYLKFKDRRSGQRRILNFGLAAQMFTGRERRKPRARRSGEQ